MNDNQSPFGPVQKWGWGRDGTTPPTMEPTDLRALLGDRYDDTIEKAREAIAGETDYLGCGCCTSYDYDEAVKRTGHRKRPYMAAHDALAAVLPELAACHYREADREVINRAMLDLHYDPEDALSDSRAIAAALSDATNGGHWEEVREAYERAMKAGLLRRTEWVGTDPNATRTTYGWVPADPDAALLAIVDADTLARLREVAEVTAR